MEISNEKEIVETATVQAMGKNKYGDVEKSELDDALDNFIEGEYISEEVNEGIYVTFTESNRSYLVDANGNVTEYNVPEMTETPAVSETTT